jgi:hypothetical protein
MYAASLRILVLTKRRQFVEVRGEKYYIEKQSKHNKKKC